MRRRPPTLLFAGLAIALALAAIAALMLGPVNLSPGNVLAALSGSGQDFERSIVVDLRLPRVCLALLVGAALAQAGATMQGIFRNPLADPSLIGVSSGAALAAALVIVLSHRTGLDHVVPVHWLLPIATFCGGLVAAALVQRLAQSEGYTPVSTMLLAGLAINAIAGAGIGLLSQLASDLALRDLTFWMFGSLGKAGWTELAIGAPIVVVAIALMLRHGNALNALLLGEAEAGHLGVDVESLKRRSLIVVVLATATSVALAGLIGFVGLLVPHLIRLRAGPDHRWLLPATALAGALLLTIADTAARVWLAPSELPIGILTAILGGPCFLWLLVRSRRYAEAL